MKTLFEGKKLYAVIIAFLLIITFFITFSVIRNHYKYVFKHVITENRLTANLLSSLMYEHQKAAISILESYAQRPLFIDAVKKKDFYRAVYHLKSLSEYHTEIDALFITDQYGTVWANYPVSKESYGKNLAYRDWYKGVSRKWRPYISTVFRLIVLEKDLTVAIAVPVFDRKGKVIGILGSTQRTLFLATFIKANILNPEKSIALLDQEGNIIFSNTVPYEENITKYPDARILEKTGAGVVTNMEIADAHEKGVISYVSIAPVKGIGWSVIVGQEKDALLKSLYGYFIRSVVAGFVVFLFLSVSLLYFRREYKYRKTKELQASEEKYKTLFNETLDGICLADEETGIIIDCNQALAALVCRDRAELIGQPQTILHPPQDNKKVFSPTFKQHLTDKQGQILKTQVVTKTGDIREVEIKANFVVLRGRKLLQGLFCDITEHKQAEITLRQAEEKYRSIFENVIEGIFQTTPEGRFLTVNPVLARIYGYSSPEELIETITDIGRQVYVNPNKRNEFLRIIQEKGVITGFELQLKRKDGGTFWASINARAVYDENGNVLYYEGTTEDITLRKEAEEKLTTTLESLRRAIGVTIQVVIATVEARDPYTAGHQRRVTDLARAIAAELGLSADRIEGIRMASSIHDIGKISIPAEILSKPTKLTDIEFSLMKAHAQYGYEILKDVESPWPLAEVVLQHHERINGSGYPRGLQGNEILMEAKILAVADVVESMASHRPYRPAKGIDTALEEIEKNKGILYDAEVVDVCLRLFREKGFKFE
jgi:PAS domain S-box-containing protein